MFDNHFGKISRRLCLKVQENEQKRAKCKAVFATHESNNEGEDHGKDKIAKARSMKGKKA